MDEFLPMVPDWLSTCGIFYLVTIAQNDPLNVIEELTGLGMNAQIALVVNADEEKLSIIRGCKLSSN